MKAFANADIGDELCSKYINLNLNFFFGAGSANQKGDFLFYSGFPRRRATGKL